MKNYKFYSLLNIIIIGLMMTVVVSCKKSSAEKTNFDFIGYISGYTSGAISPESYIQVELAQDLPSVEINKEVEEKLFSFSPSISGRTYFVNTKTVRFVPDEGELKQGKVYNATLNLGKLFRVESKYKKFNFDFKVKEQNFSIELVPFMTPDPDNLAMSSMEGLLTLANTATIGQVEKMFNLKKLSKGATISVSKKENNIYRIVINNLLRDNKDKNYILEVNGSEIGAKKKENIEISIPKIDEEKLEVLSVDYIQGSTPYILIAFNNPLQADQDLRGLISIPKLLSYTYQLDKNHIRIYSEKFTNGNLQIDLFTGLKSRRGVSLDKDHSYSVGIPNVKPQIEWEQSGNILPNSDNLSVTFKAVNLWAVDVKVIKIFQNNILYYLQENSLNVEDRSAELRRFGRLIKKTRIRLDEDDSKDLSKWNKFAVDLASVVKKEPGAIYVIELSASQECSLYNCDGITPVRPQNDRMATVKENIISEEDEVVWDQTVAGYYNNNYDWSIYSWEDSDNPCSPSYYMGNKLTKTATVVSSNIGIIAKSGSKNKITVAVTDILTTKPISGASVKAYNYQMQMIGEGKSDSDGFVDISYERGIPVVVTVTKGKDTGYLEVKDQSSLSLSRFDISGKEVEKGLKGYVYGERDIWRPGDSIYLSFIVEDRLNKIPDSHPVTLEVFSPQRQIFYREVKTEGQNGFYTFKFATSPASPTGVWQSYINVGGATFYKPLRIETVKPNRLKINLQTDSIVDGSSGFVRGEISSKWLHGSPASNLKANVQLTLSKVAIPFANYEGYTFINPLSKFAKTEKTIFEGNLNSEGIANFNAEVSVKDGAPGLLRGNILSRVFEQGGDMSFYNQSIVYSPFSYYIGIKAPTPKNSDCLETDNNLKFNIATVNKLGKPVNKDNLKYVIYKLKWSWWWDGDNDEEISSYLNSSSVSPVATGVLTTQNGKTDVNFKVDYPDWGRYLLLVTGETGEHVSGTIFYVDWPLWKGRSDKTDPEGLTMLSFSADKSSYKVDETATIIIPKSSDGHTLISLENSTGIIKKEWVKTSAKEDTKYAIKITEDMLPNVYVFATLLQPHKQTDNELPIRMYGVINLNVTDANTSLLPQISMPDELKPGKSFAVSISEKDNKSMTYTLAMVDEGLLDLTSFKTPNPWNEFYSRETLGVRTWDLFDRVVGANSGLIGSLISIGGDEALKSTSDKVNRFKPVVKFMGPFTIKKGEKKTHNITLPEYVGSVRVMVVAGGDGAYGSAQKTVAVKNDLMTLSTLPRVLGPNEEVVLPVNVFTTNKKIKDATVTISTTGMLKPDDHVTKTISFDGEKDKLVLFKLIANNKIGEEKVVIKTTGGGATYTETINIAIRNPNPPIILSQYKLIDAGTTENLTFDVDNINPYDWAKIEVSGLSGIDLNRNMDYLLGYPHGCSEQVTSQGFPLLYINQLTTLTEAEEKRIKVKVDEVIKILLSRQTADGGFRYWDGDKYPNTWVTTYAGHFLSEAANKGYNVPKDAMSKWIKFQENIATNFSSTTTGSSGYSYNMVDLQQAYRLYTLALNKKANLGAMNRLKEQKNLSLQARWRLSAAYALVGNTDVAKKLVFNQSSSVDEYPIGNDTYGSPARDVAMIMETYLLLGNIDKAIECSKSVAEALSSQYISTQTAAYALFAMSKLAEKMGKEDINIEWSLNGKKMDQLTGKNVMLQKALPLSNKYSVDIKNRGKGKVYARLIVRSQPVGNMPPLPSSKRLLLSVNYEDMKGNPLNISTLTQGTEFKAVVKVQNNGGTDLYDLALMHIVPSGWEIFNDRVMNTDSTAGNRRFNYQDIRDDRVLTYFDMPAGSKSTFSVRMQAAYLGQFYLPAISCQAMYDPAEQSFTKSQKVNVVAKE